MQWQPAINHLFCDSYFMCQVVPGCSFESKNEFFMRNLIVCSMLTKEGQKYFSSLYLNIAIFTSLLLFSRRRDLFLDKDWTKGERPVSTETAVLLYGGRSNHPFWRNQVRHKHSAWTSFFFCSVIPIILFIKMIKSLHKILVLLCFVSPHFKVWITCLIIT